MYEDAIYGQIILKPELYKSVQFILRKEYFTDSKIYELFEKGIFDYISLTSNGVNEEKLKKCISSQSQIDDLETACKRLRLEFIRKKVKATLTKYDSLITKQSPVDIIANIQTDLRNIDLLEEEEVNNISEVIFKYQKEYEEKKPRYKLGFSTLDETIQGINQTALVIVGARPSVGKSAFAANIALNTTGKVYFFSFEMEAQSVVERMIANIADIPVYEIKNRNIHKNNIPLYHKGVEKLLEKNIKFDTTPRQTIGQIRMKCIAEKYKNGLDMVIIDYLQLITPENNNITEYQHLSQVTRELKLLAMDINCPIIALAQLSRDIQKRDDGMPTLADLRGSGSLEQDANVVMFLTGDVDKELRKLYIKKNRDGKTGLIEFKFDGVKQRFTET